MDVIERSMIASITEASPPPPYPDASVATAADSVVSDAPVTSFAYVVNALIASVNGVLNQLTPNAVSAEE